MENAGKTNAVSNSELIEALSPTPCDITDDIQAWAVVYDDGEVGGIYESKGESDRMHCGESYQLVRLVPAEPVIIGA